MDETSLVPANLYIHMPVNVVRASVREGIQ